MKDYVSQMHTHARMHAGLVEERNIGPVLLPIVQNFGTEVVLAVPYIFDREMPLAGAVLISPHDADGQGLYRVPCASVGEWYTEEEAWQLEEAYAADRALLAQAY